MVKTKLFSPGVWGTALAVLGLSVSMVHASTFGSVQGKVTDAAGSPVAGVKISLAGEGSVTTDKSGSYVLDGIDPGVYQVDATKKGYQKTTVSVTITQDVPQELDLTLSQ